MANYKGSCTAILILASTRSHFIPHLIAHFIGLGKKRPFRSKWAIKWEIKCVRLGLLVLQNENCWLLYYGRLASGTSCGIVARSRKGKPGTSPLQNVRG